MIDNFFNAIKTAGVLIVIAIIIIVAVVAIRALSERVRDKEYKEHECEREAHDKIVKERQQEKIEARRDQYWNNLCLVYGDKDRDTLSTVLYWIEEFNRLPNIGEDGYNSYISQERQGCREKIKALLDYPEWIVEGEDKSNTPIWLDLDIKYIKLLLK